MSNKDFQNGFIAGYASNNGSSSLNEEYITQQFQNFKEKEIDYVTIYSYDTEDLKNRTTKYLGQPIYETEVYKNNETSYIEGRVRYALQIAYKDYEGNIGYYVDTPLKAFFDSNDGKLKFENLNTLFDAGLIVDGERYPFSKYLSNIIDETGTFYWGKIWFDSSWDNANLALDIHFDVSSRDEHAVDVLLEEVSNLLTYYGKTLLLYHKNPTEVKTIEAQYIGG